MLQKCYENLCNGCINTYMSNLGTESTIVKSGTKSNITKTKEDETMSSTNTVSSAYTRVGELQAASCKRAASYTVKFHGSCEAVNQMTRAFDRAFRKLYNVYGGKRLASWREADTSFVVRMNYTAMWTNQNGYRFESVVHLADAILNSHHFKLSETEEDIENGWYELGE